MVGAGLEAADDKELVERSKKGDETAFKQLVLKYQKKVYMIVYSMISNHQDSLELSQEVFLRVFRHLPSFEGTSSFYTWLYRITVNICIDYYRRKRLKAYEYDDRLDHAPTQAEEDVFPLVSSASRDTPTGRLLREELGAKIREAMDRLPPKHRLVFVLREEEGLSYEEIADVAGIPIGTVMSRLFHARRKLQERLAKYLH
jgi:RNA polymerase sigma-70 factor (ECF subfamily)